MDSNDKPDVIKCYKDADGEWRWTRRDGENGEVIAASTEGYVNDRDMYANISQTQCGLYTVVTEK